MQESQKELFEKRLRYDNEMAAHGPGRISPEKQERTRKENSDLLQVKSR